MYIYICMIYVIGLEPWPKNANSTYIGVNIPHTSACGTQLSHARHINALVIMGYAAYQHGNTVNPYSKSASTMGLYR